MGAGKAGASAANPTDTKAMQTGSTFKKTMLESKAAAQRRHFPPLPGKFPQKRLQPAPSKVVKLRLKGRFAVEKGKRRAHPGIQTFLRGRRRDSFVISLKLCLRIDGAGGPGAQAQAILEPEEHAGTKGFIK